MKKRQRSNGNDTSIGISDDNTISSDRLAKLKATLMLQNEEVDMNNVIIV